MSTWHSQKRWALMAADQCNGIDECEDDDDEDAIIISWA